MYFIHYFNKYKHVIIVICRKHLRILRSPLENSQAKNRSKCNRGSLVNKLLNVIAITNHGVAQIKCLDVWSKKNNVILECTTQMKYFILFNLDADLFFHSGRYYIENYSMRWRMGVMRLQGLVLLLQGHGQNYFSNKSIHLEPNRRLGLHNLSFHFHKMYLTLSRLETATTLTRIWRSSWVRLENHVNIVF